MTNKIKTALISVSDKTGLENLAEAFKKHSINVLSTGGTAKVLRDLGLEVIDVSDHTGSPEILDGRVKTLHPKVHGGLLGKVDDERHLQQMQENNISPIDLVIVNLYPFERTLASNANFDTMIENIDIGGPSMVRSCAKNFASKTIITDPEDYQELIDQLDTNGGATSFEFRKISAAKAFAKTAYYDSIISNWFANQCGQVFPQSFSYPSKLKQSLRYGENPHQKAAFYSASHNFGVASAKQIQGKELSYNNINDLDAALAIALEYDEPTAVIIKHANPCGAAVADNLTDAYAKALECDPVSAFGGIYAFNQTIEEELANKIAQIFCEAIIAPDISDVALDILSKKKNLRILTTGDFPKLNSQLMLKSVLGGVLVQESDGLATDPKTLEVVTNRAPTEEELHDLLFANRLCKHVKSNAIVLAKNQASIGIGAGQMSRVDSVRIATMKAKDGENNQDRVKNSVLASDAFFPFADGLIEAAKNGVTAVIQPGGSMRDEEVIKAANEYNIAMVFTKNRHFKH